MSENDCTIVCSRGILKSCDIYSKNIISSFDHVDDNLIANLKPYDTVYVCNTAIKTFMNRYYKKINVPIILVSGDGIHTVPTTYPHMSSIILNSSKIVHWFAQNCLLDHPKITRIPLGLDYHTLATKSTPWGSQQAPIDQEKEILQLRIGAKPFYERPAKIYTTFNLEMDRGDREEAFNSIPVDLIDYEPVPISRLDSLKKQLDYAFVASPHGYGLDCHRTWEALLMGCIPIMKTSKVNGVGGLDPLYDGLPVLFVEKWSDITQGLLNTTIEQFRAKYNGEIYEKMHLQYWINRINSYKYRPVSDVVSLNVTLGPLKDSDAICPTDIVPIAHYIDPQHISIETVSVSDKFVPYSITVNSTNYIIDEQNKVLDIKSNFSTELTTRVQCIPRKIMQTWKTKNIEGSDINYPVSALKKMNPEYAYTLLDDDDCIEYIKKHYGERELSAYFALKPTAFRADLFRYLYLYKEGGIYLDIKSAPTKPFYSMINDKQELLLVKDLNNNGVYNGLIGCIPGHPLIKIAYEESIARIERKFYGTLNSFLITGPGLFKWAFNKWQGLYLHAPITDFIKPDIIAWQHLYQLGGKGIYDTNNIKTFNRVFSTYYNKFNKSDTHYSTLWKNKDVYYSLPSTSNNSDIIAIPMSILESEINATDFVTILHKVDSDTIKVITISIETTFKPYRISINGIPFRISKQNQIIPFKNNHTVLEKGLGQKIPRRIIQTWMTKDLTGSQLNYPVEAMKKMNPEYEHIIFDDNDCIEYIKKHYGERELSAYLVLKPAAFRADLFRYLYLFKEGGIYVDIKTSPLQPFYSLLAKNPELLLTRDRKEFGIYNGIIGCSPGHPLMKVAYEEAIRRIERRFYGNTSTNTLEITGPTLFGWAYNHLYKIDQKVPINVNYNTEKVSWLLFSENDERYIINNRSENIFNRSFSSYYTDFNNKDRHYSTLWKNRDVYYN